MASSPLLLKGCCCFTSYASVPTYQAANGTYAHFEYHKNYDVRQNVHDILRCLNFLRLKNSRERACIPKNGRMNLTADLC